MFNLPVTLFQKRPGQARLLGKPIFDPPLDRQFWWMGGLASGLGGTVVGLIGSLALSFNGWDMSRLWFLVDDRRAC